MESEGDFRTSVATMRNTLIFYTKTTHFVVKGVIMTYKEWAKQYYDCASDLKEKAESIREKMKGSKEPELSALSEKLRVMYEMYLDCIHTADELAKRRGEC